MSRPPVEEPMLDAAESADRSAPRDQDYPWMSSAAWMERHRVLMAIPKEQRLKAQLVFVGDSIVEGWDEKSFDENFGRYAALRFGIGGDMTQHVLWRIDQGELAELDPKVVVLLIGTNNLGNALDLPNEVARGVAAVVQSLKQKLPRAVLLVLGILPRDEAKALLRQRVAETNTLLARLENNRDVRYVDLGEKFLAADGSIPVAIMADGLHPTPEGYALFATSLEPVLTKLLSQRY